MNLVSFDRINTKDKNLTELFLYSKSIKKYILGINKLTKSVQKSVKVDGIIDDFTRVQSSNKKEILHINDIAKDSIILVVSTGSPLEVKHKLDSLGFVNFNYLSFYRYSSLCLLAPPFLLDFENDFKNNHDKYKQLYCLLYDDISKKVFKKIINFKITFDFEFMYGFVNNHTEQYFDKKLIPDIQNITFVDGGGYIGDTAKQVILNFPDFKKIYLIEPNKQNINIAKKRLAHMQNIVFLNIGLSNSKATLNFNEQKSFSSIYGAGTTSVCVDTLDNIIREKVDFIKLDIEGAEQDAIDGAKRIIKTYNPIIACCIYHRAEDWHKVPQKILAINNNYEIYIRHYMEGIFETVMYFIPKTNQNKLACGSL